MACSVKSSTSASLPGCDRTCYWLPPVQSQIVSWRPRQVGPAGCGVDENWWAHRSCELLSRTLHTFTVVRSATVVLCCTIAVRLVRVRRDKGSEDGAARLCNLHRPCVYHCRPTRTSPATATPFGGECDTHTRCDRLRTTLNNLRRASRAVDAVAGAASSLLADVDGAGRLACATGRRRRCAATYPNNSSATRGRIPRVLTYHGSPPTTSRLGYNTEYVLAPY